MTSLHLDRSFLLSYSEASYHVIPLKGGCTVCSRGFPHFRNVVVFLKVTDDYNIS